MIGTAFRYLGATVSAITCAAVLLLLVNMVAMMFTGFFGQRFGAWLFFIAGGAVGLCLSLSARFARQNRTNAAIILAWIPVGLAVSWYVGTGLLVFALGW
jgi:hypothetical protein